MMIVLSLILATAAWFFVPDAPTGVAIVLFIASHSVFVNRKPNLHD